VAATLRGVAHDDGDDVLATSDISEPPREQPGIAEPGAASDQIRRLECSTDPVSVGREQIWVLFGYMSLALRREIDLAPR